MGHISVIEALGAECAPSPYHIRKATAALSQTAVLHELEIAGGGMSAILSRGGDPYRLVLALRMRSQWPRTLHRARQHVVSGIRGGRVAPRRGFHLPLEGTGE